MNLGGTVDAMFKEVEVMNNLAHPNVIDIKDVFNTPSYLVLVLELCVVSRCPRWLLVRTWPADWLRLLCVLFHLVQSAPLHESEWRSNQSTSV